MSKRIHVGVVVCNREPSIAAQVEGLLTEAGFVRLTVRPVPDEDWAAVLIEDGPALQARGDAARVLIQDAGYDVIRVEPGRYMVGPRQTFARARAA